MARVLNVEKGLVQTCNTESATFQQRCFVFTCLKLHYTDVSIQVSILRFRCKSNCSNLGLLQHPKETGEW
jgi:hypothetical protein